MQGFIGLVVFVIIGWLFSTARSAIRWRAVALGLTLQIALCGGLLYIPGTQAVFGALNVAVLALQTATTAGTTFVFGYLGGGPAPFQITSPSQQFIFLFGALPIVLVLSALTALLTYWRILPWIIGGLARVLERSFNFSGAVGFGAAANIFLGMVEAPLFVRPYLARMTAAELFVLMTTGMSTIAGTVLVLYASILAPTVPNAFGHLLVASVINVPAGIVFALLMVPETATPAREAWDPPRGANSAMEALANGTSAGLAMCLQIGAMLVVLVSLVHLVNTILAGFPAIAGAPATMERLLGFGLAPIAWVMGIPWHEAAAAGSILGTKTVLNEMLAYIDLTNLSADTLSPRSRLILTYALCGFANIGSLGIMVAGLGELIPARRSDVLALGPRSLLAGTLATFSTGAVVGLFDTCFGG